MFVVDIQSVSTAASLSIVELPLWVNHCQEIYVFKMLFLVLWETFEINF